MKLTAIFAALLLCLALAGCGGGEEASQSPASGGESRSIATQRTSATNGAATLQAFCCWLLC